jgi:hypothetical protein
MNDYSYSRLGLKKLMDMHQRELDLARAGAAMILSQNCVAPDMSSSAAECVEM